MSVDLIKLDQDGKYIFGDFAKAQARDGIKHSWILHSITTAQSVKGLPPFLEATNFQNPVDSNQSSWVYNVGQSFMDYLKSNPEVFSHINMVMKTKDEGKIPWFHLYPVQQLVTFANGERTPVLVDVGGGIGTDLCRLDEHLRGSLSPGQLILQDLKQVVEEARDLGSIIQAQAHDFFTEQPIRNAAAYYL